MSIPNALTRRHNRLNPINPRATDNLPTRRELGSFALRRLAVF